MVYYVYSALLSVVAACYIQTLAGEDVASFFILQGLSQPYKPIITHVL